MHNDLVFVYGTLKRGYHNHSWLKGASFVKEATTVKGYLLYDLGAYPGLVKAPNGQGKQIKGELFKVTQSILKGLDVLEGVAFGLYERVRIKLLNTKEPVWGYLYKHDVSECQEIGNIWEGD